ncbi:UvrD-helicase domain-containing protein [Polynucleobacter antarcticus]|uniref:UvrD-helicase domain-containing protein n=1 Tax=Polynucleobacter antarcticus TaxID=1743162 RepID=UPI0020C5DF40|nr:UvrD-helicase domain-containing protein [Polynucleobacter antarcticus]
MSKEFDYAIACNPDKSVIVSACAGSGKTWLLVARMIRLLLAGTKPQEILALTFTRKAAQEMRDRLYGLLEEFSSSDDVSLTKELVKRGLSESEAITLLPEARALYLKVLASPQAIVIDTFHGWFGRLLGAAPVSADVQPGFSLREDAKRLQEECMEDWWGNLPVDLKKYYDILLAEFGASETQKFLMGNYSLFKQRGAWSFFQGACAAQGISPIQHLDRCLSCLGKPNPLEAFWGEVQTKDNLDFLYQCFSHGTPTQIGRVPIIEKAIELHRTGKSVMEIVNEWQSIFLTQKLTPLADIAATSAPMLKYLAQSGGNPAEITAIRNQWVEAFEALFAWQSEALIHQLNDAWFAMSEAMLLHMAKAKESMRVRDFDDLEIGVSQLMADPANAAYLQSRLDAKYKHILIDEFQDTNPLQWQILRSWLDGYGGDGSMPSVFIVGDPKQSIYRFRRADPRLFDSARDFLVNKLKAESLSQNKTRRNAPAINDAVNDIFLAGTLPPSYPYSPQTTAWEAPKVLKSDALMQSDDTTTGEAQLLPLIDRVEKEQLERLGTAFDNAIEDASQTIGIAQRYEEGKQVSRLIHHILATRQVVDKKDGKEYWRPAYASDFILLVKRRQYLPQFERALREAGLAYDSSRLGGLLNTLEIDDLIALLTVLVSPRHDLPLAQVLRSPIFSFTEVQMQMLSINVGDPHFDDSFWWDALQASSHPETQKAARYLAHWRQLGEALPVHDLLDLIYAESNLRIKYAVVAQNLARAQVLANLDAFLELALNQDGGRYPSLSRFIDDMNAMRRGDIDETPDEGDVEAESEADANDDIGEVDVDSELSEEDQHKRVRLMTIHGAKGLEAPFVIMLDTNHTEWKAPHRGVLLDWSPDQISPSHLSLYTSKSLTGERSLIHNKENEVSQNENWNLLYVAMTRAKQGLWFSGVQGRTKTGIQERSWYGRALAAGMSTLDLDALNLQDTTSKPQDIKAELGSMPFKMDHFQIEWDLAVQSHQDNLAQIEDGELAREQIAKALDQTQVQPDPEILEEGVHFHKLLEFLTVSSDNVLAPSLPSEQEVMNWLDVDQERAIKVLERTKTVLEAPALQPYLISGPWLQAWNEIDIATEEGKSYRMDRLVEFEDHLAILDYKLTIPAQGSEQYEKYRKQLQGYQTELGRIRADKPSKAYLISATGSIKEIN